VRLDGGVSCSSVSLELSMERFFGLSIQLGLVREWKERENIMHYVGEREAERREGENKRERERKYVQ
jgi:hypothetical protein